VRKSYISTIVKIIKHSTNVEFILIVCIFCCCFVFDFEEWHHGRHLNSEGLRQKATETHSNSANRIS